MQTNMRAEQSGEATQGDYGIVEKIRPQASCDIKQRRVFRAAGKRLQSVGHARIRVRTLVRPHFLRGMYPVVEHVRVILPPGGSERPKGRIGFVVPVHFLVKVREAQNRADGYQDRDD